MESYKLFSLGMASLTLHNLRFTYFTACTSNFWLLSSNHCMNISYMSFIHSPIVEHLGC